MLRKPESIRRGAVLLIVLQALAALGDTRNMADWNPPETIVGLIHLFEPIGSVAKHFRVIGLVGVRAQRLDRLPDDMLTMTKGSSL